MKVRWFAAILPLIIPTLVTVSPNARAQAHPAEDTITTPPIEALTSKARELYVEGSRLYQDGKYDKALASFQAAWSLKRHWQIAGMLGLCELKLGRFVASATHITFSIEHADASLSSSERARLEGLLFNARQNVGTLVFPGTANKGEVVVDGHVVGHLPQDKAVYVQPGAHEVRLRSERQVSSPTRVTVAAGKKAEVTWKPSGTSEAPGRDTGEIKGAGTKETAKTDGQQDTMAKGTSTGIGAREAVVIAEAAVGVIGAGIGGVYALKRNGLETTNRDNQVACMAGDSGACAAAQSAQGDLDSTKSVTSAGLVIGAVGLGASLVTWLAWPEAPGKGEASSRSAGELFFGRGKASTAKTVTVASLWGLGALSLGASVWSAMDATGKADDETQYLTDHGGLKNICSAQPQSDACSESWRLHLEQRDAVMRTQLLLGVGVGLVSTGVLLDAALGNERGTAVTVGYAPTRGGGLVMVGGAF